MTRFIKFGLALALALGLCSLATPAAHASLVLMLDDLSTVGVDAIVIDNMAAGSVSSGGNVSTVADDDPLLGVVEFDGSIGAFIVQTSIGTSKPLLGGPGVANMDLLNLSITGASGGTLVISVTDTDFTLNATGSASLKSEIGGTTDGTVDAFQIYDTSNTEFGDASPFVVTHPTQGPGAYSDTQTLSVPITAGALFSLTEVLTVTLGSGDLMTGDFESTLAVPEPSTFALGLVGVVGLVGVGLRRRFRSTRAA